MEASTTSYPESDPDALNLKERNALILKYSPLVRSIAFRIIKTLPPNIEADDLIQTGMLGLIEALTRYTLEREDSFECYAAQRIRGAMLDSLRREDWVPRSVRINIGKIQKFTKNFEKKHGRPPHVRGNL